MKLGDIILYKLIAIDMDGTLLNDQHTVDKQTIKTLEEANHLGIKIVLCSGRPIGGMKSYVDALNLNQKGDYTIAYNGGLVQDAYTGDNIIEFSLNYEHLKQLYALSLELHTPMHFFDTKGVYTPNKNINHYTVYEAFLNNIPLFYRNIEDINPDQPLSKIMFIDHPEHLKKVIPKIPKELYKKYTIVQSAPHFLEFVHPETNKGLAVQKLAEKLGIKREEVICIGDNENDLSMIEYAGCGVAMGNAVEKIKAAADFETLSNNENGVAHAIEKLILNQLKQK